MEPHYENFSDDAISALNRAVMKHLFDPNVSLIDLGWRILDRQDQKIEKELCVRVHVREKLFGEAFEAFAKSYPDRVINKDQIQFDNVDVPEGDYKAQLWPWWGWPTQTSQNPRSRIMNPMRGGISISNALKFGYGTLGGKVIDRDTGDELILSNWHVLVGSWYTWGDVPIYQPGRGDGGQPMHTVAILKKHAMDQMIDAAVAQLTDDRPLINDQYNIGAVTGHDDPVIGMRVTKSGRRTGVTTGLVTGIKGRMAMNYQGIRRVIRHVAHISQSPEGGLVSDSGDSGSWWLEESSRRAVGLHFAGANKPEYGLAIAMPQVLDALNIDIDTTDSELPSPELSRRREMETVKVR